MPSAVPSIGAVAAVKYVETVAGGEVTESELAGNVNPTEADRFSRPIGPTFVTAPSRFGCCGSICPRGNSNGTFASASFVGEAERFVAECDFPSTRFRSSRCRSCKEPIMLHVAIAVAHNSASPP